MDGVIRQERAVGDSVRSESAEERVQGLLAVVEVGVQLPSSQG